MQLCYCVFYDEIKLILIQANKFIYYLVVFKNIKIKWHRGSAQTVLMHKHIIIYRWRVAINYLYGTIQYNTCE